MAARFWVGGTGTWDNVATTNWSTTSGGAGGSAAPTSADAVTFDGNSGASAVITVNANVTAASVALGVTGGVFVGTLDFATNNNSPTFGTFSFSGGGTRTINLGTGTFTITGTSGSVFDNTTTTGETWVPSTATILLAATPTGSRTVTVGSGKTISTLQINNTTDPAITYPVVISSGIYTNFVPTAVRWIAPASGGTAVITNGFSWDGSSSAPISLMIGSQSGTSGTFSTSGAITLTYAAIEGITKAGTGSISASNSFDLGANTGVSITGPVAGAVVGHVIGA